MGATPHRIMCIFRCFHFSNINLQVKLINNYFDIHMVTVKMIVVIQLALRQI